eukprot:TRINITY_DN35216_c0_g1_i1.p1 TRINITY_DN35216_c0_g1~~TRINITY_DN35216_c0_g1_i1.p1  ORF type:complete len:208 (-),score=33.31 TRINITY_DN35216_c0_g1_i1:263-886(-)
MAGNSEECSAALSAPRTGRRTPCCTHLLTACCSFMVGGFGGGAAVFGTVKSMGGDNTAPLPIPAPCNCPHGDSCDPKKLDGLFSGKVSVSKTVLGMTVHVKYTLSHTFDASNGLVDVDLIPEQSPFNMMKPFHCQRVPVSVNKTACTLAFTDECLQSNYDENYIADMQYVWDGNGVITVYESLKTPVFSQVYVWNETRSDAPHKLVI